MTETENSILNDYNKLNGEFVLVLDKIYRLIGVLKEEDEDYYWILYDGNDVCLISCLCKLIKLKGRLLDEDYNEIIRMSKLNHLDFLYKGDELINYKNNIKHDMLYYNNRSILIGLNFKLK